MVCSVLYFCVCRPSIRPPVRMHSNEPPNQSPPQPPKPPQRFLSHARNGLDALGLIWFVVGNMWLFGGDVEICPHPNRSPLYTLCVAMVFINYAQLCLPCVVVRDRGLGWRGVSMEMMGGWTMPSIAAAGVPPTRPHTRQRTY